MISPLFVFKNRFADVKERKKKKIVFGGGVIMQSIILLPDKYGSQKMSKRQSTVKEKKGFLFGRDLKIAALFFAIKIFLVGRSSALLF